MGMGMRRTVRSDPTLQAKEKHGGGGGGRGGGDDSSSILYQSPALEVKSWGRLVSPVGSQQLQSKWAPSPELWEIPGTALLGIIMPSLILTAAV